MRVSLSFIVLTTLALAACGTEQQSASDLRQAWDRPNSPSQLTVNYDAMLANLPLAGRAGVVPWADTYWPNTQRGLAWRWQGGQSVPLMPPREMVRRMSIAELDRLSPAEKFDILNGDYSYPFTRAELGRTSPTQASWWGLCHGWAQASHLFREPRQTVVANPDGVQIPFASSDIKGLLAFYQQYRRPNSSINFLGLRCESGVLDGSPACRDVNAGSFHIILANLIGRQRQVVVGDLHSTDQVWNYPIFEYQSRIASTNGLIYPSAAPGTVRIVTVVTRIRYTSLIRPQRAPVGLNSNVTSTKTFSYTLELDRAGKIIGGEWIGDHPDFVWRQTPPTFSGYFARLGMLYSAAL